MADWISVTLQRKKNSNIKSKIPPALPTYVDRGQLALELNIYFDYCNNNSSFILATQHLNFLSWFENSKFISFGGQQAQSTFRNRSAS